MIAPPQNGQPAKPLSMVAVGSLIGLTLLVALLVFPSWGGHGASPRTLALSRLKQSSVAVLIYAADNDDRFPAADRWCDDVAANIKSDALTPSKFDNVLVTPAMNGFLDLKPVPTANPDKAVMLFQTVASGKNLWGGPAGVFVDNKKGGVFSFVDSHAKWMPTSTWSTVRWRP